MGRRRKVREGERVSSTQNLKREGGGGGGESS